MAAVALVLALAVGTPSANAVPDRAYVANQGSDTVSVIDTTTGTVVAIVPVGDAPRGVAVTPDGARVYVANADSDTVSVIDTAPDTVVAIVPVGDRPVGVAVSPDGTRVYVTNASSDTVSVIETATNTVIDTVEVGDGPVGVAISADGTRAYVTNNNSGTVSVIDTATNTVVATVVLDRDDEPVGVAVTPDGTRAYVARNDVNSVAVIDTATDTVVTTVSVGDFPVGVAVTPDGAQAYVTNSGSDTVSVIDTATNTVVATLPVGDAPTAVAVSPDGAQAYVTNTLSDSVSVIDTTTNTVVATVPVGDAPFGVAFTPAGSSSPLVASISTQATASTTLGQPISDTATVSGTGPAPTGTVTFTAYGPNDATCAGAPAFTSAAQPLSGGTPSTATSGPFTPTAPGAFRWRASYSGDANYEAGATACNDANETSTVGFQGPHMTLTKSAPAYMAAPATVTYTYTLVNDGTDTLYHVGISDNRCAPVNNTSGFSTGPEANQLLESGETWTFNCTQTITTPGTYTNTAQASGFNTQTGLQVLSNQAQATVTVTSGLPGAHMTLSKQASNPSTGQAPLTVTYTFTVVNDGSHPLSRVQLTDDLCPNPIYRAGDFDSDGVIGPGEAWTYTCTMTHASIGTYTNSATVSATDTQTGLPVTSNVAQSTVTVTGPAPTTTTGPHMTLSKSANPTAGSAPLNVTYTYTLVNDGTDTLFHVSVTDNACSPVTLRSGDVNADQLLNPGETWTFTCTRVLTATTTNSATATATNTQTGLPVTSNTASATVTVGGGAGPGPGPISGPHITLSKSANPPSGAAPLNVTYTYTLVNDGTDTLFHVGVTDNACSPVTLQSGDVNGDQLLNAGETWTFRCTTTLTATTTNSATARGSNTQTGLAVTSNTAQATVTVT